jgi:hypothetical protein
MERLREPVQPLVRGRPVQCVEQRRGDRTRLGRRAVAARTE